MKNVALLILCSFTFLSFQVNNQKKQPMSVSDIRAKITNEIQTTKKVFNWENADNHLLYSALIQTDSVVIIGYRQNGNRISKMIDVDINDSKWVEAKSDLQEKIINGAEKSGKTYKNSYLIGKEPSNRKLPYFYARIFDLDLIQELRNDPRVRYIQPVGFKLFTGGAGCGPDGYVNPCDRIFVNNNSNSNKDYYSWHLANPAHRINQAWNVSDNKGSGIKVGIFDTGISQKFIDDFNSGDSGNSSITPVNTFAPDGGSNAYIDKCGHGTNIAGLIAGPKTNNGGVFGIAYKANLMPFKTLNDVIIGDIDLEIGDPEIEGIVNAFNIAIERNVRIVNMSIGNSEIANNFFFKDAINDALRMAYENGIIMFAAAGTYPDFDIIDPIVNLLPVVYPASSEYTLAVTGIKEIDGTTCTECGEGPEVDFVVVMERDNGGRTITYGIGDSYNEVNNVYSNSNKYLDDSFGGSSAATATMSGITALLWGEHPNWSRDRVISQLILSSSNNLEKDDKHGWGTVDVYEALTENLASQSEVNDKILIENILLPKLPPPSDNNWNVKINNEVINFKRQETEISGSPSMFIDDYESCDKFIFDFPITNVLNISLWIEDGLIKNCEYNESDDLDFYTGEFNVFDDTGAVAINYDSDNGDFEYSFILNYRKYNSEEVIDLYPNDVIPEDYCESSEPIIVFYDNTNQGGNLICSLEVENETVINFQNFDQCQDDDAESMSIQNIPAGTIIKLYDDVNGSEQDDVLTIFALVDVVSANINTLEASFETENIRVIYEGVNGLNSAVSLMEVSTSDLTGCTESYACNYNPFALEDDDSCFFEDEPCGFGGIWVRSENPEGSNCVCNGANTISSGAAVLQFNQFTGVNCAGNTYFDAGNGVNQTYTSDWYYAIGENGNSANFPPPLPSNVILTNNTIEAYYANLGGVNGLQAILTILIEELSPLDVQVSQTMKITNNSINIINFKLFHYLDLDKNEDTIENAVLVEQDGCNLITKVNNIYDPNQVCYFAVNAADGYEIDAYPNLCSKLFYGIPNLSNTGLPLIENDYTQALQFNGILNPGNSLTGETLLNFGNKPESAIIDAITGQCTFPSTPQPENCNVLSLGNSACPITNLNELQDNCAASANSPRGDYACQYFCIADRTCEEFLTNGNNGWASGFVSYIWDYFGRRNDGPLYNNAECTDFSPIIGELMSDYLCFAAEGFGDHYFTEMTPGFFSFCTYCASQDASEWDDMHDDFLENAIVPCFNELDEMPDFLSCISSQSTQFSARLLRELAQVYCTASNNNEVNLVDNSTDIIDSFVNDFLAGNFCCAIDGITNQFGLDFISTCSDLDIIPVGGIVTVVIDGIEVIGDGIDDFGDWLQGYLPLQRIDSDPNNPDVVYFIDLDESYYTVENNVLTITGSPSPYAGFSQIVNVFSIDADSVVTLVKQFIITDNDTDGDLLGYTYELNNGLDPNTPNTLNTDQDNDGLNDFLEAVIQSNPLENDTDGDGFGDLVEVTNTTDFNNAESFPGSFNCLDGVQNGNEQGIDCGGDCPEDCPTCDDGVQNGDEEGVDCGGSCPQSCETCVGIIDECGVCEGSGIAEGTCDCEGTLPTTWYADNDGDGLGDPNNSTEICDQPESYVANADDENDGSPCETPPQPGTFECEE